MDNLNDLKNIWLTANTTALPDVGEIRSVIKKYRRNKLLKLSAILITALFLIMMMTMVIFNYKSVMITTRLGEAGIMAAALILAISNISSLRRFYRYSDQSNKDFVTFLEQTRMRKHNYYKRTQVVGLTLASAGLLLYIYEGVYNKPMLCVIAYSLTIIYILLIWLVFRPLAFKRQDRKLEATINNFNHVLKQF